MTQAAPFFIARIEPDGTQCDAWPEQPLLTSMEQGGIDWPSSCRNGTCRTCLGQLVEGTVRYAIEWPGLTAEEKEEGCKIETANFVFPLLASNCISRLLSSSILKFIAQTKPVICR